MTDMSRGSSSTLLGCLGIGVAALALVFVVAAFFDNRCYSTIRGDVPIYPAAVLVTDAHEFLANTFIIYESDDPVETVETWYRQQITQRMRESIAAGNPVGRPPWAGVYFVDVNEAGRTQIVFAMRCM